MIEVESYCRDLEAYLCRKNDGHLIRIAGPAFEQVMGWAAQGIPLAVAQSGIDRYFERYYRKGPRRRPVRIEFCELDVLDAFDAWRRALGLGNLTAATVESPDGVAPLPAPGRARRSLATHIETTIGRLTALRGSDKAGATLSTALESAVRALDRLRPEAPRVRGAARDALLAELTTIDRALMTAAVEALAASDRASIEAEATRELSSFRARMADHAYAQSHAASVNRLVRIQFALPDVEWA